MCGFYILMSVDGFVTYLKRSISALGACGFLYVRVMFKNMSVQGAFVGL